MGLCDLRIRTTRARSMRPRMAARTARALVASARSSNARARRTCPLRWAIIARRPRRAARRCRRLAIRRRRSARRRCAASLSTVMVRYSTSRSVRAACSQAERGSSLPYIRGASCHGLRADGPPVYNVRGAHRTYLVRSDMWLSMIPSKHCRADALPCLNNSGAWDFSAPARSPF